MPAIDVPSRQSQYLIGCSEGILTVPRDGWWRLAVEEDWPQIPQIKVDGKAILLGVECRWSKWNGDQWESIIADDGSQLLQGHHYGITSCSSSRKAISSGRR
jgi:hypothetical protein